ncbi:MAG: hypothetical protein ABII27_09135 [bacterium]
MMKKLKEVVLILMLMFVFSYLLNFVWESFHAVYLYEDHKFSSELYVPMVHYVSTIDALIVSGIYITVSVLFRNLLWIKFMNKINIIAFLLFGLLSAIIVEYRAVYLVRKWNYNSIMPTIFGIGISPLVQLSITGILALLLTKRVLYPHKVLLS